MDALLHHSSIMKNIVVCYPAAAASPTKRPATGSQPQEAKHKQVKWDTVNGGWALWQLLITYE